MNRIELAERRYRDIIPERLAATDRAARYWRMPLSEIEAWISEYVLPAVEELLPRPLFRTHATWPQLTLVVGAGTPERVAIEQVDRALVAEAVAPEGWQPAPLLGRHCRNWRRRRRLRRRPRSSLSRALVTYQFPPQLTVIHSSHTTYLNSARLPNGLGLIWCAAMTIWAQWAA